MTTPVIDENFSDLFDRQIALNINNEGNLESHYPYSPERYRLYVDDVRQQIQYDGEPTQFEDTADSFKLKPQADGEVVRLETTEIFRYHVQYVLEFSIAQQTNQNLQSGDVVVVGYGEPDLENATIAADDSVTLGPAADGWFFVWDANIGVQKVKLEQYRDGTLQHSNLRNVSQALTDWSRRAGEVAWYSVMQTKFVESYTENGEGINNLIGTTAMDDDKGPLVGNHHVTAAIRTGADGAASLELEVGSIGVRTFGDIDSIIRRKSSFVSTSGTAVDVTDEFTPVLAIRSDPDRSIVNVQLTDIDVAEFTGSGDIILAAFAFNPDNLLDAGGNPIVDGDYSTPAAHSSIGSVIQETSAVDQFPDEDGTIVTSTANPGGYQEGFGSLYTSGGGSKAPTTQAGQQAKRTLTERDVVVFLANATATGDIKFEYTTEQEW